METLPIELLDSLFKYCTVKDVLNVACCNKSHYHILKPLLWRSVKIPISSLFEELEPFVENLRYVSRLHINGNFRTLEELYEEIVSDNDEDNDGTPDDQMNDGILHEGDHVQGPQWETVDIVFLLHRLLSYCNPLKVTSLDTTLDGIGLECVLRTLPNIKTLLLRVEEEVDGRMLNQLSDLRELKLHMYGDAFTNECFKEMVDGKQLRRLTIVCGFPLSHDVLATLSELTCLEQLDISHTVYLDEVLDVSPLSRLTNLVDLTLQPHRLLDDGLKLLCQSLTKLRRLRLDSTSFTDTALSDVSILTALTHLSLKSCRGITTNCLLHLFPLQLHSIALSADICKVPAGTVLDACVAGLNRIPTLKKVSVTSYSHRSHMKNLAVMTNSLCHNETWKLKFETHYHEMKSTFTR